MAFIRTLCRKFVPSTTVPCRQASYIVLLPEVPDDTPETNSLLNPKELPKFDELTLKKCYSAVGKLCLDYETGIWKLEEKLNDPSDNCDFDSVIGKLDALYFNLTSTWCSVKAVNVVRNDEVDNDFYLKIHERARKARGFTFLSVPIYQFCKKLYAKGESNITDVQKRVLRKFLLESRLNGIELPTKKNDNLAHNLNKIEGHKDTYRKKLHEATKRFAHRIDDAEIVKDFPKSLLQSMSLNRNYTEGPWKVTLQPEVYHGFLEHCPDQNLRFNAWRAYVMRCSNANDRQLSNSTHVEEIRFCRLCQAKELGFENFADMSMETKMAGSVGNVLATIENLAAKAKPVQSEELKGLEEFARTRGHGGTFEECDVAYWRREQRDQLYKLHNTEVKKCFPLDRILPNLFELCANLFGLIIEESKLENCYLWHPDVQYFQISDTDGKKRASFYYDPFARPGQKSESSTYMFPIRSRSANVDPVASLVFNFIKPTADEPLLLSFKEVSQIFKEFGRCLQSLISTTIYSEAAGLANIEWDAVDMCSNFMQSWLNDPAVLTKLSVYNDSTDTQNSAIINDIIASQSHLAAYDLCNELFYSHLDMRLHTEDIFWIEIVDELHSRYKHFPMHKKESLCSWFSPIISEVWAASYYSNLWSRILAQDVFEAFKECDESEVPDVGRRFRSTFLEQGGGTHSSEIFRQFRGRDPCPQALLTHLGLS